MLRKIFFLLLFILPVVALSQDKPQKVSKPASQATGGRSIPDAASKTTDTVATIDMYKIITLDRDTTFVDTSLTIRKEYEVNYLRRDNFGLLTFPNEGQPYNILHFGLKDFNPFPEFGFKAKHFAYMEVEDINYYNVATPFTDLFYRSVVEQGQVLDAFVTLNTSKNLNFAIAYKGLRSLGKYINQLSSNGNLRFITGYNTSDKRYHLKLHFTAQDFTNQENGGIVNNDEFESGEEPFTDREQLNVYFRDASSILKGNRYFVDHTFRLNKNNPNSIVFHHMFNYEHKTYEFIQYGANAVFGPAYRSTISNKTRYNRMYNLIGAAYSNEKLGSVEFYIEDYNYNYYYNRLVFDQQGQIAVPNRINDRINTYGARYTYQKDNWKGTALLSNSITDQSLANIDLSVRYRFDDQNSVGVRYQNMNKLPDLNYRLHQSDYAEYNWYNDFKNEKINNIEIDAKTKWLNVSAQYSMLNDHLFFTNDFENFISTDVDTLIVKPKQYANTINYFSIKASKEFKWWKLGLDNTILFQKVDQQDKVLNVPDLVTRNTLYYSDHFFKKALFLQTGVIFQYFTEYHANNYNPLLGEFYVQDRSKIGGYPLLDFFINAKIQEFRVFLKAEHFNAGFGKPNYYAAPNYPYRDFIIRFGVIWDFFS